MLRAALLDAVPVPNIVVGMDKSKPPSPAPATTVVPATVPNGKMIGQLVPVAWPMAWEMGLVGVAGV